MRPSRTLPSLTCAAVVAALSSYITVASGLEMLDGTVCDTSDGAVLVQQLVDSRDATIFQGQDKLSSGEDRFMVGATKNGLRRGLLAFTFSSSDSSESDVLPLFPSDAQVECTELRLTVVTDDTDDKVAMPRVTLHRLTSQWTTSGMNRLTGVNGGTVKTGDVTWGYRAYPDAVWQRPGGDYDPETVVATSEPTTGATVHAFGNTLTMARLVQDWIDTESDAFNAGFLLSGEEEADTTTDDKYVRYHGLENAPDLIPRLIVTYTSPSQGKDHRDYADYRPEAGPSMDDGDNDSAHGSFRFVVNVLCFVGGTLLGGVLVSSFLRFRHRRSSSSGTTRTRTEAVATATTTSEDPVVAQADHAII